MNMVRNVSEKQSTPRSIEKLVDENVVNSSCRMTSYSCRARNQWKEHI